jgi:hypothetical protein
MKQIKEEASTAVMFDKANRNEAQQRKSAPFLHPSLPFPSNKPTEQDGKRKQMRG